VAIQLSAVLLGSEVFIGLGKSLLTQLDKGVGPALKKHANAVIREASTKHMGGRRTSAIWIPAPRPPYQRRAKPLRVTAKPHQLGIFTGRLKKSFRLATGKSGDTDYATISSDVPYAGLHETGGPFMAFGRYPATMPARPFMQPAMDRKSSDFKDEMGTIISFERR
jgi:phage gpG-like protein